MLGQFGNKCHQAISAHRANKATSFIQAYAVLTDVPPVFVLYDSPSWSSAYLLFLLGVSVWNGGGFYIEVFGRQCVYLYGLLIFSDKA